MFKKIIALTLALIIMIMPMTASAVTWSALTNLLSTAGGSSYTYVDEENGNTTIEQEGDVVTVTGGVVQFYSSNGEITEAGTYYLYDVTAQNLTACALDGTVSIVLGQGAQATNATTWAVGEGQNMNVTVEDASVNSLSVVAVEGASGSLKIEEDGEVNFSGVVSNGEGSTATFVNDGWAGDAYAGAYAGGETTVQNNSDIDYLDIISNEGGTVNATNDGSIEVWAYVSANGNGTTTLVNNGTLEGGSANAAGGSASIVNNGEVNDWLSAGVYYDENTQSSASISGSGVNNGGSSAWIDYIVAEGASVPTEAQLQQFAQQAIQLNGCAAGTTEVYVWLYNAEGYPIDAEGNVVPWDEDYEGIVIEVTFGEEEEEEPYDEAKAQQEAEEALRQSRAVGGVTTSIFWNYQMYLGHSTYNGRVYYQGEKEMTLQSINWLPDGGKNYTLRINKNEPALADVEIRVAQDILDVCERCGITTITLVDKEEIPFAQFAVADLIGAREMYGLEAEELLCVSADPEAEVMKVNLAGEYLPLEPETEEAE